MIRLLPGVVSGTDSAHEKDSSQQELRELSQQKYTTRKRALLLLPAKRDLFLV